MAYKTRQQSLILGLLKENADKHLTADQITLALKDEQVGRTTVYRHLEKLCASGTVRRYTLEDGTCACYQFCGGGDECRQHFHLKCIRCGRLTHLECDYLSDLQRHIFDHHGFNVDGSRTVLYGICGDCTKTERKPEDNDK